jgi:SAM-dependent methyltransferase
LRDEAFDTVVSNMVLHSVASLDLCVAELARTLRPGGWLVFSILHPARVMPVQPLAAATPDDPTTDGAIGAIENYVHERRLDARLRLGEVTWLPAPVRYHHRMLSTYAASLRASGLVTIDLVEPLPSADVVERFGYMEAFWSLAPFLVWMARKPRKPGDAPTSIV